MLKETATPGSKKLGFFKRMAPLAFDKQSAEVAECLASTALNFVASPLPLGRPVPASESRQGGGVISSVSAGHESHPSTTHAATEALFSFLEEKVAAKLKLAQQKTL
jgi:hypothetical protein